MFVTSPQRQFPNCMQLAPHFTVEWDAKEDSLEIRLTAQIDENQYMAFGLSPREGEWVNAVVLYDYCKTNQKLNKLEQFFTLRINI